LRQFRLASLSPLPFPVNRAAAATTSYYEHTYPGHPVQVRSVRAAVPLAPATAEPLVTQAARAVKALDDPGLVIRLV
jgi:hypothetical protein